MMMMSTNTNKNNTAVIIRWGLCRNVLMLLIGIQLSILVYSGFTAPEQLAESYLWQLYGGDAPSTTTRTTTTTTQQPRSHGSQVSTTTTTTKVIDANGSSGAIVDATLEAYVAHYTIERQEQPQPNMEALKQQLSQRETQASKSTGHIIKPCTYFNGSKRMMQKTCGGTQQELLAYNGLKGVERTYCGITLAPETFATIPASSCSIDHEESVLLFPQSSDNHFPDIEFKKIDKPNEPVAPLKDCDAPCQFTTETCGNGKTGLGCLEPKSTVEWSIGGTDWIFKYYHLLPGTRLDRKGLREPFFTASQSSHADVQLAPPNFDFTQFRSVSPAVDFDMVDKKVAMLGSTACEAAGAYGWARKFGDMFVSYGDCNHNTNLPGGLSLSSADDRLTLMKKNMFALIIDGTSDKDFVSGAVYEALLAGVIPVYYGAPNIKDYVPKDSILVGNIVSKKDEANQIVKDIVSNRTLWESFHEWRKQDDSFPPHLLEKFESTQTDPQCRICRWAYATRYGMGWDFTRQVLRQTEISRELCTNQAGILTKPFLETWVSSEKATSTTIEGEKCDSLKHGTAVIEGDSFKVTRSFSVHDNVVDLTLDSVTAANDIVLRLELGIKNWEGAHYKNVHRLIDSPSSPLFTSVAIQDQVARTTVLADWVTTFSCPSHGIIEFVVSPSSDDERRKLRIIVEDINHLRDVKTEYATSPFAKPLMQDFLDPLELFIVTRAIVD